MSRARKRGPPTSAPSPPNWRCSPARALADVGRCRSPGPTRRERSAGACCKRGDGGSEKIRRARGRDCSVTLDESRGIVKELSRRSEAGSHKFNLASRNDASVSGAHRNGCPCGAKMLTLRTRYGYLITDE